MSNHLRPGNRGHGLTTDAGRTRSEDSWIEISSQPSSSSLSSAADEIVTTGLRVHQMPASYRRRRQRPGRPSRLNIASRAGSAGPASSQEEYEESESDDDDHGITSSGEGLTLLPTHVRDVTVESSDDDENRTAVNYPINNDNVFTPQPNAFSHPSGHSARYASQPVPGSYFPAQPERRHSARHSYPSRTAARVQHSPFNMLSPNHNAAADHEAALRASLSTLQSFAAAARGLPKSSSRATADPAPPASNRIQTNTLRMVPASVLEQNSPLLAPATEPTFQPTIRRTSTSTSASADIRSTKSEAKRKGASGRGSSKERRLIKKRRNSGAVYGADDMIVSPTLFTWVVSVGVVVVFSAISFSAGYSMGKEAGRFEAGMPGSAEGATACAREAGKSGLGFRKSKLFSIASGVGVGA